MFDPNSRRPSIAYSGLGNTVKYAHKAESGWGNTLVTTTAAGAGFVNLALSGSSNVYGPVISYYDLAAADLVLATYNRTQPAGQRWSTTTIASRGVVGAYSELIVDYGNTATLYGYTRNTDSVARYAWNFQTFNYESTPVVFGGGRNLSVASSSSPDDDLAYLDTASGNMFVR